MALQIKHPTVISTTLYDLDPTGEAKISFRQATARENQIRDQLVFGPQVRAFTADGMEIKQSVPWSVRQEIECRLTVCGAEGIEGPDGKPLFRFKQEGGKTVLVMSDDHGAVVKTAKPPHQ